MAETEEIQAVQHFAERVENFVDENKQAVAIGAGALVVIIAASLFVFLKWLPERNLKAQREIFMAEIAFQKDSFNLALNGNGVNKGFLEVQKKYGWTKAANLCNYYIGICYLNTGKYADAVTYLDKFSTSDAVLGAAKLNAIGDAYAEQNKAADAEKYYAKAAGFSDNDQFTPYYLVKLGMYLETQKKFKEAIEQYTKVKEKYPMSDEGRDIEKYISRATAQL